MNTRRLTVRRSLAALVAASAVVAVAIAVGRSDRAEGQPPTPSTTHLPSPTATDLEHELTSRSVGPSLARGTGPIPSAYRSPSLPNLPAASALETPNGGSFTVTKLDDGGMAVLTRRRDGTLASVVEKNAALVTHQATTFDEAGRAQYGFFGLSLSEGRSGAGTGRTVGTSCGTVLWSSDGHATPNPKYFGVNFATIPIGLGRNAVASAIVLAAQVWNDNENACGRANNAMNALQYIGNIGNTPGSVDGQLTVGFLGSNFCQSASFIACTTLNYGSADMDIVFASEHTPDLSATGAAGKVDIRTVAVHEWGHVWAFRHTSSQANVMYPSVMRGLYGGRILSDGDAYGNNAMY